MNPSDIRLIRAGAICGLVGGAAYIAIAILAGDAPHSTAEYLRDTGTHPHQVLWHFALAGAAVLWLVGFLGLGKSLQAGGFPNAARLGTVFGVIACAILVAMLITQASVMFSTGRTFLAAQSDAERQSVIAVYRAVRAVDQGLDLAFDLFFFTGWICLGIAMMRHAAFGKILGTVLIIPFLVDAPYQLWYAPTPPPIDIGPFATPILLFVYFKLFRSARNLVPESSRAASAGDSTFARR